MVTRRLKSAFHCGISKAVLPGGSSESSADLKTKITELKEKMKAYERKPEVYEDPDITAANQKIFEIDKALQIGRKNLSELKPLYQ